MDRLTVPAGYEALEAGDRRGVPRRAPRPALAAPGRPAHGPRGGGRQPQPRVHRALRGVAGHPRHRAQAVAAVGPRVRRGLAAHRGAGGPRGARLRGVLARRGRGAARLPRVRRAALRARARGPRRPPRLARRAQRRRDPRGAAAVVGTFAARIAFWTSDFGLQPEERKARLVASSNPELCRITEDLVLTEPYLEHEHNWHHPALDPLVAEVRADAGAPARGRRAQARVPDPRRGAHPRRPPHRVGHGRRRAHGRHRPRVRVLRPGRVRPRRPVGQRGDRGGTRDQARAAGCLPGPPRGDRPRVLGRVPHGARAAVARARGPVPRGRLPRGVAAHRVARRASASRARR